MFPTTPKFIYGVLFFILIIYLIWFYISDLQPLVQATFSPLGSKNLLCVISIQLLVLYPKAKGNGILRLIRVDPLLAQALTTHSPTLGKSLTSLLNRSQMGIMFSSFPFPWFVQQDGESEGTLWSSTEGSTLPGQCQWQRLEAENEGVKDQAFSICIKHTPFIPPIFWASYLFLKALVFSSVKWG